MEQILLAQLKQARINQAEAAFNEDYVEAGVWSIKIEALEDVLSESEVIEHYDNVVPING